MGAGDSQPRRVPKPVESYRRRDPPAEIPREFVEALWEMAKALLEEVPGVKLFNKIAEPFFKKILDSSKDNILDKVFERMGTIVSDELTRNDISKLKGKITERTRWLKTQYKWYVEKGWEDEELHDMLLREELEYRSFRELLMQDTWQERGLPVFLLAANLHLLILQELAMRDPHDIDNPVDSAHAHSIRELAVDYANHVDKVTDLVLQKREEAVHLYTSSTSRGLDVYSEYIFWKDAKTNTEGKKHTLVYKYSAGESYEEEKYPESRATAEAECRERQQEVREELDRELGYPKTELAEQWKQLVETPLGKM